MTHQPRLEAQPYAWNLLTDGQKDCVLKIHEWLATVCNFDITSDAQPSYPLPTIDAKRWSNVLLIDGSRGSGKTAALLTLVAIWTEGLTSSADKVTLLAEQPNEDSRSLPRRLRVQSLLAGPLRGKLLPLPILDLQPLPASTSLLLWLSARFHDWVRFLEHESHASGSTEPAKWQAAWDSQLASSRYRFTLPESAD